MFAVASRLDQTGALELLEVLGGVGDGEPVKSLIGRGVVVKVCGTCMARCGLYKNHPYFDGAEQSTMNALAQWVVDSDKVLTF